MSEDYYEEGPLQFQKKVKPTRQTESTTKETADVGYVSSRGMKEAMLLSRDGFDETKNNPERVDTIF